MIPSSRLALPNDKTITISVISGRSKGLAHRIMKPKNSIGNIGSGANIEIDDPQVSSLHCAVGVTEDTVRLCDLDSTNGTYVNDVRVLRRLNSAAGHHSSETLDGHKVNQSSISGYFLFMLFMQALASDLREGV